METISVIVPIYNTGFYLKQCLDSILSQTYTNLDIILLNDGSTDGSAALCEKYAAKDNRIRVIHKGRSGGVGAARNTALTYVKGDYVLFVDHDDWLVEHHIATLYQSLKETGSDIAVANFAQYHEERRTFSFHIREEDYFQKVYTPQEWFSVQYEGRQCLSQCFTVPWCKLYKASLFEQIVYPEDEKVEDDCTTWKLYLLADKIVFSNVAIYYHRKLASSITGTVQNVHIFPLKSIEERVTILSLLGFDISQELRAYQWRLKLHKESYLEAGMISEYKKCLNKLTIIDRWVQKNEG